MAQNHFSLPWEILPTEIAKSCNLFIETVK